MPPPPDDDGFFAALRAAPDDESLRLVYADWLDDRGDPRGPFLRLEARAFALAAGEEFAAVRRELTALACGLDVRWLAVAGRVPVEVGPFHDNLRRHHLNVPGPFYTCGGCLACEAPEQAASDLLAPLGSDIDITHFVRQPETGEEYARAIMAAKVCCVEDVRYCGTDAAVIRALGNSQAYCDYVIDEDCPTHQLAESCFPALPDGVVATIPTPSDSHAYDFDVINGPEDEPWYRFWQAWIILFALTMLVQIIQLYWKRP